MDPLWLLLIVPGTSFLTIGIMALFWVGDDSDARMIALLKNQYCEILHWNNDKPTEERWFDMLARHDAERREIEG